MELPRSSLDALLSALRPTETPTHEAVEDLRNSGVGRSLHALWHALTPTDTPTREEIEDLRKTGIVWLRPRQAAHRYLFEETKGATSALEALARLRLVSYSVWLAVVEGLWPSQIQRLRQWAQTEKKLELGLEYRPTSRTRLIQSYDHFLQSHKTTNKAKDRTDYAGVAIPVRWVLQSYPNFHRAPDRVLWMEACEGVEAVRDRFSQQSTCSDRPLIPLYRFVGVKNDLASNWYFWPPVCILTLSRRFAACGVPVLVPLKPDLTWLEDKVVGRVIPLMQDVLETTTGREQRRERFCGASHVHVSLMSDTRLLESVFSAIMASQSVREITAITASDSHHGGHERAWLWLAVVLQRTIEVVNVDCQGLTMEDFYILENALRASNPLSLLFPSTMVPVNKTDDVFVASAQSFRLYQPSLETIGTDINESTISYDLPLENLPVISVAEDWATVLLPGWGRAWVAYEDVSLSIMEQQSRQTGRGPSRLSLTNLRSDQARVILALLRLIGNHVTAISISSSPRPVFALTRFISAAPFLESVMLTCPNVNELTIKEMSLPTLSILSRAYEDGTLRPEHLILENINVEDRADCDHFFHSLANRDHPMARQLRTFFCTIHGRADSFSSIKPAILHLLLHNQQLDEFQLDLGDHGYLRIEEMIYQEEVDGLNEARLPLRSKLALLSVMSTDEHSSKRIKTDRNILARPRQAIRWLDRDVVTTIFAFASRVRFLRVQYCGVQL